MLTGVMAYQRGDFEAADVLLQRHPDAERVHREATDWANRTLKELV
jgi:hypothetical protein